MDEIIKKKLLVGDKFMAEMYLRQPGFKCKPFSKSNKRVQKIKETGEKRIA